MNYEVRYTSPTMEIKSLWDRAATREEASEKALAMRRTVNAGPLPFNEKRKLLDSITIVGGQ